MECRSMSTYLLVHGAWHSGESWARVTPLLAAAGHRVLAPTLTGYGDTVHLAGPEVGLDTHVADVGWLRSMLSDQPVRCLQQPVRLDNPDLNKIPRTHIHCTVGAPAGHQRRAVPAIQPNGTPAQVWELPTGHDCMITMPAELSEL